MKKSSTPRCKGVIRANEGAIATSWGWGVIRAGQDFNATSSFNFEIQKYYQNKTKFNGVFSRSNSPKIKDWVYIINLDE